MEIISRVSALATILDPWISFHRGLVDSQPKPLILPILTSMLDSLSFSFSTTFLVLKGKI